MTEYFKAYYIMNKFIKCLSNKKSSDGFTLVELLLAAAITTFVVSAAGFGLVTITEKNKKSQAETERRVELNRALDFISDEVRQAKKIAKVASTGDAASLSIVAPDFNDSGKTPVLTLEVPGVSQRVIYYIASSSSPWLGPKVIYRWGPSFLGNGQYSNPSNPSAWSGQPLIDLVVDTVDDQNINCPDPDNNPVTTADNWKPNPNVSSGKPGFYACVDPSGKIAEIHLRGQLTDAYANPIKDNTGNNVPPLEVRSKVFSRPL